MASSEMQAVYSKEKGDMLQLKSEAQSLEHEDEWKTEICNIYKELLSLKSEDIKEIEHVL